MNSEKKLYCPRCEKSIVPGRVDEVKQELRDRFDSSALDEGACPVCGTPLIEIDSEGDST